MIRIFGPDSQQIRRAVDDLNGLVQLGAELDAGRGYNGKASNAR